MIQVSIHKLIMGDVIKFYHKNSAEDIDNVLEQAVGEYEDAVIIGWNKYNELEVRASQNLNHMEINWLVDAFKNKLLNGDYGEDE